MLTPSSHLKILRKTLIVLFCLWHATAIALYSIPDEALDPVSTYLRDYGRPIVRPYIFTTSQWQLWNLFSPDPLRRVTFHGIEIQEGELWRMVANMAPNALPWWGDADELKLLRRLEENTNGGTQFQERYLQLFCKEHRLPRGMPIRLVTIQTVIEVPPNTSIAWWRTQLLKWNPVFPTVTSCT